MNLIPHPSGTGYRVTIDEGTWIENTDGSGLTLAEAREVMDSVEAARRGGFARRVSPDVASQSAAPVPRSKGASGYVAARSDRRPLSRPPRSRGRGGRL